MAVNDSSSARELVMSITLKELILAVQERKLSKEQLEDYYDQLSILEARMHEEMAELEKKEALYLDASEEKTNADKERKWRATKEGLRAIELKNYIRSVKPLLSSVKNRIYQRIF